MDKLKSCPFCGETKILFSTSLTNLEPIKGMTFYSATCTNCLAKSELECCEENAIMSWNHRPLEDALQHKLGIAMEALKKIVFEGNQELADPSNMHDWADEALKELEDRR